MTAPYLAVNGALAKSAHIVIPETGVWVAEINYAGDGPTSGAATLTCGDLVGVGVCDEFRSGSYGLRDWAFIVGGAEGWRKVLPARAWHNDAILKVSTVIGDTAAECGETVSGAPTTPLGADFVRAAGTGASVLNRLTPSAWHVGLDGITRFGVIAQREIGAAYDILDYDPPRRSATLATETLSAIALGAVVRDARLRAPIKIRGIMIDAEPSRVRVHVWGDAP